METETKEIIKEKEYVHGRGCGNYLNDGWYDGCGDGGGAGSRPCAAG